jgi:hypothetical protein
MNHPTKTPKDHVSTDHISRANLLNTKQAAEYLHLSPGPLEVWRSTKRYSLAYIKVGRFVKYRKEALDAFLAAQTVAIPV